MYVSMKKIFFSKNQGNWYFDFLLCSYEVTLCCDNVSHISHIAVCPHRRATSSRTTLWTCCGNRVGSARSHRRRLTRWWTLCGRSSPPLRCSWSRVRVRPSWSSGHASSTPGNVTFLFLCQLSCLARFLSIFDKNHPKLYHNFPWNSALWQNNNNSNNLIVRKVWDTF